MELLRPPFPTQTQIFSIISALPPTASSPTTLDKKTPFKPRTTCFKPRITCFKPLLNPLFLTNSSCKNLRIKAGLGGLPNRRNSLRKKLEPELGVPQRTQEDLDPTESNLGSSRSKQVNGQVGTNETDSQSDNSQNFKQIGDSANGQLFTSVSIPSTLLPKVSRVGLTAVYGFLFVWMMKNLCELGDDERELTKFEKEMLRRKIKSRMEKERLQKCKSEKPSEALMERSNIKQATSNQEESEIAKMDVKIQKIQMMARRVRRFEMAECSANEVDESDEQTSNAVPDMERETVGEARDSVKKDEPECMVHTADINGSNKEVQIMSMQRGLLIEETLKDQPLTPN